jgi:hypothetical protein
MLNEQPVHPARKYDPANLFRVTQNIHPANS